MKKNVLILSMFLTFGFLTSCSDDSESTPTLSLEKTVYSLLADGDVEVVLNASAPAIEDVNVSFNLVGEAVEGEDYQISAQEFLIKKGESSAIVTISAFENYEADKSIVIKLNTTPGYGLGANQQSVIAVDAKEKIIFSFTQQYSVLTQTVEVELEVKTLNGTFISTEELRIAFIVDETSTGIEGEHYSIEGDVSEFVFAPGTSKATVTVNYLKADPEKDLVIFKIGDLGIGFIPGEYIKTNVKVYGPTTLGKLFGKWKFESMVNKDWFASAVYPASDADGLPSNNTDADILEFIIGENATLKPTMTGDLGKYFRESTLEFVEERQEVYQYSGFPPKRANITVMKMSKANVAFSSTDVNERETFIGFRILEDGETLEVTVYDYEPTEFLIDTYNSAKTWSDPAMAYYQMYFNFKKVNE
jgi:hypothetical protein